jgi:transposase InsO family protein
MEHHLIRVRTPKHNGKVERFNATNKRQREPRRIHLALRGLTPHEKFDGLRLARPVTAVHLSPIWTLPAIIRLYRISSPYYLQYGTGTHG